MIRVSNVSSTLYDVKHYETVNGIFIADFINAQTARTEAFLTGRPVWCAERKLLMIKRDIQSYTSSSLIH